MEVFRIPVTADIMARLLALHSRPDEPIIAVLDRHLPRCEANDETPGFGAHDTDRLMTAGRISYRLFGANHTARNAADAMCHVLRMLGQGKPDFFQHLAPRVVGRSRNHLARSREAVYPDRPELAKHTREISPGWFVGTNIANREKQAILQAACETAGIGFGTDLTINLAST